MTEPLRARHYDIFLSYKRLDDAAREALHNALVKAGFAVWWDAKLGTGNFRDQLRDEINRCDLVIALWSQQAADHPDEVLHEMSHAFGIEKLLAIKLDDAPIPKQFGQENFLPFDQWSDPEQAAKQIAHIITEAQKLGARRSRLHAAPIPTTIPVELGEIPAAPDRLIGRDREMQLLRTAWNTPATNAVVLHALGGAGKSALLRSFINEQLAKGGDGAARIYGWSAYSQGSGDQKRADADGFISRALKDFGYDGEPIRDATERAKTLAHLIQQQRTLLLLDGLEPLQDPPKLNKGRFKDKGLATLIKMLGNQNPGLMVLTTRQEVPELEGCGELVVHHPLDKLSDEAGADLLVELGVTGRERDLRAAVHDLEGHALSVTLLGTFLVEVCGGDIHGRERFDFGNVILHADELENADETTLPAKRAAKVMAGYLEQFDKLAKQSAGAGGPERVLLHLLGLFDRPAEGDAVDVLLAEHIDGLSDELFFEPVQKSKFFGLKKWTETRDVSKHERSARLREAKGRLRKLQLMAKADPHDPHGLDAHPIVRAFFATRLNETAPEAARAAHDKLYRHYAAAAPDFPDTLEQMQPLFHAITHGVKAGHVQEAYDEILKRRLERGNDDYMCRVHGAFAANLAVLGSFFQKPWSKPHPDLRQVSQSWVLDSAGFALTALSRLAESVAPREAGLEMDVASKDYANAARAGGELCNTLSSLGHVTRAIGVAEQALNHAEKSRDKVLLEKRRSNLSIALLMEGDLKRAAVISAEAEEMHEKWQPEFPQLYSRGGYQYGDLLLAQTDERQTNAEQALKRGHYQLALAQKYLGDGIALHDIGFGWLLTGRAQDALKLPEAAASLDEAVDAMRKSGQEQFVPQALLARAAHLRWRIAAGETALLPRLRDDLAEIEDIASPEMRLYLTDLALQRAHIALDIDQDLEQAAKQTALAAQLIETTGYHRRDEELAALRLSHAVARETLS